MRPKLSITCGLAVIGLASSALAGEEVSDAKAVVPPPPEPTCPWTLQAAILYLEADSSEYDDQDYEFGYRVALSYQSDPAGWGYRLRFFDFEGTDDDGSTRPEIQAIDLEGFRALSLGGWNGEWSIGVRSMDFEEPHNSHTHVDYSGIGPVVGVDLTRELSGPWSIYVNGRAAYLFGEDDDDEIDDDVSMVELGAGIQRAMSLGGCDGYVRLGVEGHRYFDMDGDSDDADLFGGVLTFGFGF